MHKGLVLGAALKIKSLYLELHSFDQYEGSFTQIMCLVSSSNFCLGEGPTVVELAVIILWGVL